MCSSSFSSTLPSRPAAPRISASPSSASQGSGRFRPSASSDGAKPLTGPTWQRRYRRNPAGSCATNSAVARISDGVARERLDAVPSATRSGCLLMLHLVEDMDKRHHKRKADQAQQNQSKIHSRLRERKTDPSMRTNMRRHAYRRVPGDQRQLSRDQRKSPQSQWIFAPPPEALASADATIGVGP